MLKEFGKWLMDIAKYLVTAGLLSYFFNAVSNSTLLIIISSAITLALLIPGMYLIKSGENEVYGKKSKRKRR